MDEMRNFMRSLRTAPTFAHVVVGATLAVWIMKATWLDFIPAAHPALFGLGHVVDGLLSAIVAGYVFFVLFAIYPDYRQRRAIAPFLFGRMKHIVGDCLGVIEKIETGSGLGIPFKTAGAKDVDRAFAATLTIKPPAQFVDGSGSPVTWPAFFTYRYGRTLNAIDELFQQGPYLDGEVKLLLTCIRDAPFYKMSQAAGPGPIKNSDLSAWGPSFYKYLKDCRQLARWHDAHRLSGVVPLLPAIL